MNDDTIIIPKNSLEEIRIGLQEFKGQNLAYIRVFFDVGADDWRPTKKGVTLQAGRLDDLIAALQKTREIAAKRGWLENKKQVKNGENK